jgi:hypothetical protein
MENTKKNKYFEKNRSRQSVRNSSLKIALLRFRCPRFYRGCLSSKMNDLKDQLAVTGRTGVKKITKRHYRVAPFSSWGCRGTNQRLDP